MNDAASDPDLYPQLSNAAMGRAPGMPLSPELPSNYQFDATPSPRTVQTAEGVPMRVLDASRRKRCVGALLTRSTNLAGAATRGRVEAAVFEAQLRESAAMRNLEEAAIQLKQNIDMALWFEGQYSTDPDKMPFQPGYKDKIIAAVRNIPNSYKVVEEMIQRVLPLIENTKKELAAVSGTVSATLP
jgi:hypothetical protein